ncbi:MAG: NUDIX hydrolase [Vicinamibacterales bacterium]
MTDAPPPPIRPAATVVVLRPDVTASGVEVLLVRRNRSIAFMGGAHVFPGGRLDAGDASAEPAARAGLAGLDAVTRCTDLARDDEAAYRVAAIRELLEEAGLLLATRDGRPVSAAEAATLRARQPTDGAFAAFAATHGLRLALDAVMPFAHWVTPPVEIRRFDTRFLMARLPAGQQASHDEGETTALEWMRPDDAVARAIAGDILLPPPTWTTLRRLARFASVDEAWDWAATTPIVRIEPGFSREGGTTTLMLPGDPTYPLPAGLEPIAETRFELVDGAWRPVRGSDPIQGGA